MTETKNSSIDGTTDGPDGNPNVLIVGAGPTGLTLALELARRGVTFRLIEAAPGPQPGSRGKGIQPRTLEVLEDLGIVDCVLANGRMAMPIRSIAPDGQVTLGGAEPETLRDRPDIPYTTSLITPEWRVEETLRLRLAEFGGAVEFGTALEGFEQSDEGVSAVVVKSGEAETLTARWLVGCDGGHSIVRKQAGIAFEGETREEVRMIVADVEVDGLDRDAWHMWRHEEGLVSLCPLPSTGAFQYQAAVAPGQDPEPSLANMQTILERRSGRSDIRIHEPEWSSLWRANIRSVDRYREGCVFLAGDAAHIHSPAGGQGMNTGIQDAHNLGWKLATVTGGASPALLDSYESERRPVAAEVLALSNARLAQTLEQKGIPTRRDRSTTQLDVGYRGSALARDDRDEDALLRAGDRAPDATKLTTVEGERRLFELTRGGRFTLLMFGDTTAIEASPSDLIRTLHIVGQPAGPDDLADTEGHLANAYGAFDLTLVLIRPDGYVALISDAGDVSAVSDYLAAIGILINDARPLENQIRKTAMESRHLVDPELAALLDQLPASAPLTLDSLPAARASSAAMLASVPVPEFPGRTVSERFVPGPEGAPDVRVLLYGPTRRTQPTVGLLWIHGGGFISGSVDAEDIVVRQLAAELGCVVVSVNYRLAPQTPHPGPVEDCYAALSWLYTNAAELGVDRERLALVGSSAGGGLAAALALLARDRSEIRLAFQCLNAPMLDDRTVKMDPPHPYAGEFVWTREANRFGWTSLLGQAPGSGGVSPYAAAARAGNLEGLPPAFIAVGALDLFLEEDMEYARRLTRAGVPTELHVYPGTFHGYQMVTQAQVTQRAMRDRTNAIKRALKL